MLNQTMPTRAAIERRYPLEQTLAMRGRLIAVCHRYLESGLGDVDRTIILR